MNYVFLIASALKHKFFVRIVGMVNNAGLHVISRKLNYVESAL